MKKGSHQAVPYTKLIGLVASTTYLEMGVYDHFLSDLQPLEVEKSTLSYFVAQTRNTPRFVRLMNLYNILKDGSHTSNGFGVRHKRKVCNRT